MKVLIAGGGIAGPAAAIALSKAGIDSALYEAYPPSAGEGAFLTIAANGQDALRAIDAAHATSPSTAQGASMALEDAVVLAQCLRDFPSVQEALAGFEGLRRERVERVVAAGASTGNPSPPSAGPRSGNPPAWLFGHHIDWDETVRVPSSPADA